MGRALFHPLCPARGRDVVRDIEEQYYLDSGEERDWPPKLLDDMIGQGKLGVKSGKGFYTYPDPPIKIWPGCTSKGFITRRLRQGYLQKKTNPRRLYLGLQNY